MSLVIIFILIFNLYFVFGVKKSKPLPLHFVPINESKAIIKNTVNQNTKLASICLGNMSSFDENFNRILMKKILDKRMTLVGINRLHATMWLVKAAMALPYPGRRLGGLTVDQLCLNIFF